MEPTRNARTVRGLRRTFYALSRRHGEALYLYKVQEGSGTTDYSTGIVTRDYDRVFVRNAVPLPTTSKRNVTYTPAMMQSVRNFAWQGGAGTEQVDASFLIANRDLRDWCPIDSTQFVGWRGEFFQVETANHFDGGVIIGCKQAKGSGPALWQNHDVWNNCLNWVS